MEQLKKLLSEVFDEDWNVKACGREKCKQLINLLEEMYPDKDFGFEDTGFMNVEAIKEITETLGV